MYLLFSPFSAVYLRFSFLFASECTFGFKIYSAEVKASYTIHILEDGTVP